ncbi:hypothetical protein NPIL_670591 [Nephila pilipes]|uniref:Uncharacterized protein n=1 Tax=Nephila pilipes TaxID=299642 RepID=A0A8X6UAF1_NEPPI|nr:hypothetical protein NPIL_670591 [Nephila pilipes]
MLILGHRAFIRDEIVGCSHTIDQLQEDCWFTRNPSDFQLDKPKNHYGPGDIVRYSKFIGLTLHSKASNYPIWLELNSPPESRVRVYHLQVVVAREMLPNRNFPPVDSMHGSSVTFLNDSITKAMTSSIGSSQTVRRRSLTSPRQPSGNPCIGGRIPKQDQNQTVSAGKDLLKNSQE